MRGEITLKRLIADGERRVEALAKGREERARAREAAQQARWQAGPEGRSDRQDLRAAWYESGARYYAEHYTDFINWQRRVR